jgi:F-type H+-transporting ATPase subunit gamma
MPTLKEVQLKIKGVKKTKQITKAMNMVATSRLRGAPAAWTLFAPMPAKFAEVLGSLAEKAGEEASPLLVPKEDGQKDPYRSVHLRSRSVRRLQYQPDG